MDKEGYNGYMSIIGSGRGISPVFFRRHFRGGADLPGRTIHLQTDSLPAPPLTAHLHNRTRVDTAGRKKGGALGT